MRAQYLTFELAGQNYGLEILCVQEIRAWEPPTRLPHAPEHVLGVINLRGAVVPILDLRRRFGLSLSEQLRPPVIVVVNTQTQRGLVTSGLLVDAVCDVCEIAAASIQAAPEVTSQLDREVMRGLCTLQGRLLILLEPERLLRHITTGAEAEAAGSGTKLGISGAEASA